LTYQSPESSDCLDFRIDEGEEGLGREKSSKLRESDGLSASDTDAGRPVVVIAIIGSSNERSCFLQKGTTSQKIPHPNEGPLH